MTNTRRRWAVPLTALAVGAMLLSACSAGGGDTPAQTQSAPGSTSGSAAPTETASNPAEINLFLIPSPSSTALQKMATEFTAKTGIKVNFTETEYGTAHQKALLSIQAKQGAFDVVQYDNTFLAAFANAGALAPLNDYVKNSPEYDINDFSTALQTYGDYKGQTYGLVLSTEPFLLWYRKSLLEKAGQKVPTTWDEYKAVAAATNKDGVAGQVMGYGANTDWWWMQLVWSFGGKLYTDDLKPQVNTPEAIAATQYYKDVLQYAPKGALGLTSDDATNQFVSTDIAQIIQYSGYAPLMYDPKTSSYPDDILAADVPAGKVNAVELAGWNIGIAADSPNKDAAWQFLEFALGKTNAKQYLEFGAAAIGRKSITQDPEMIKKYPYLSLLALDKPDLLVYPYPHLVVWPEFDKACADTLADIVAGKVPVEQGLNELNEQLAAILAKEPPA
jgi:ABC-type glycerol-3-phosphate transport system substrate-binding protein